MPAEMMERQFGPLTVKIDRAGCIASANCMVIASDVFDFDDTEVCAFVGEKVEISREKLLEACKICPVEALILLDADGTQLFPQK
jgi:ferredoxin